MLSTTLPTMLSDQAQLITLMRLDEPTMSETHDSTTPPQADGERAGNAAETTQAPREIGGREGPEPTRYGDWEKNGRCIDF